MSTRTDEIVRCIYRISTWQPQYGITFNQFLIADERPALIHTGMRDLHGTIRNAIRGVRDPAKLVYVVLLHWGRRRKRRDGSIHERSAEIGVDRVDAVNSAQC